MNEVWHDHPVPDELAAFVEGQLPADRRAAVESHVLQCPECSGDMKQFPKDRAPLLPKLSQDLQATEYPGSVLNETTIAPDPQPSAIPLDAVEAPVTGPPELADHSRYRVIAKLGEGGMGVVYKAEHKVMERSVALKVISKGLTANPSAVKRFAQEVRAAARLSHPNIVTAYDAEKVGSLHFLVMEFVEGISLNRIVQESGRLPVADACDYARQAALGLQHACERGMIHRDIKPHNLMLAAQGQVKILDFGLARIVDQPRASGSLTDTGSLMGTPDFIAPEQARDSHKADIRSDIYSLGCTLYYLLTGHAPFPEGTAVQKLAAHVRRAPRPLNELRNDVPKSLAQVVARMLAKDPDQRYQIPREVADALTPFTLLEVGLEVTTDIFHPGIEPTPSLPEVLRLKKRSRWLLFGLAVFLVGIVISGFFTFRSINDDLPTNDLPHEKYVTNSIGMKLALIPAGVFTMGSSPEEIVRVKKEVKGLVYPDWAEHEGPPHQVGITKPFYMGIHEVMVGEFRQFVLDTKYQTQAEKQGGARRILPDGQEKMHAQTNWLNPGFDQTEEHPVVCVSWNDAQAFCNWLSKKEEKVYRLPTEVEWEYACRAGTTTRYSCGNSNSVKDFANLADASIKRKWPTFKYPNGKETWDDKYPFTSPSGQFLPNGFGLRDMHGNVNEWCLDWRGRYVETKNAIDDPKGSMADQFRAVRGGDWHNPALYCRSSMRWPVDPGSRGNNIGFRVMSTNITPTLPVVFKISDPASEKRTGLEVGGKGIFNIKGTIAASAPKVTRKNAVNFQILKEGEKNPVVPFEVPLNGLGKMPTLKPKSFAPTWRKDGVFAEVKGRGLIEFPPVPVSWYVLEAELMIHAYDSQIGFRLDDYKADQALLLSISQRNLNLPEQQCVLINIRKHKQTWSGGHRFELGERVPVKLVVGDPGGILFLNGKPALKCEMRPADLSLTIFSSVDTSSITIYRCSFREVQEEDIGGLEGWKLPARP